MLVAETTIDEVIRRAILSFCFIKPNRIKDKLKIHNLWKHGHAVGLLILMAKLTTFTHVKLGLINIVIQYGDEMGLIENQDYDPRFYPTQEGVHKILSALTVGHLKKMIMNNLRPAG